MSATDFSTCVCNVSNHFTNVKELTYTKNPVFSVSKTRLIFVPVPEFVRTCVSVLQSLVFPHFTYLHPSTYFGDGVETH